MIIYLSEWNKVLWFEKWAYQGDLTATFINRNHFALYAGMILITGAALLSQSWSESVRRKKGRDRLEALREWMPKVGIPQSFLLAIVFTSIVLSHSRSGVFLTLIGLGCYFFLYQIYLQAWRRTIIMSGIAVIVLVAILCLIIEFPDRFTVLFTDYLIPDNFKIYRIALQALQDNPFFGYGLNGFESEFRLYQQGLVTTYNHAHSDFLESLLDLGIPAGLALWTAVALLLSGLWHGIRNRRQNGLFSALGLSASVMMLGHGAVDFSFQIPGDVMTWAAILGAGLGQSWSQSDRQKAA
jgi:O-antigen ligase